jgi:hypothetical protein
MAPSPAVLGSTGAGLAAAEFQALHSHTYQLTDVELQALVSLVQDLLEADGQQPVTMHTCEPYATFPNESAGVSIF